MKLTELSGVITKAYLCYPNLKMSDAVIAAWYSYFRECDFNTFEQAFNFAMTDEGRTFFPTPGEVKSYYQNINRSKLSEVKALPAPPEETIPDSKRAENLARFKKIYNDMLEKIKEKNKALELEQITPKAENLNNHFGWHNKKSLDWESRLKVFNKILPDLKPVNQATKKPKQSNELFSKWLDEEFNKKYKAMDENGNIYITGNPNAQRIVFTQIGTHQIEFPKAKMIYTYEEAVKEINKGK